MSVTKVLYSLKVKGIAQGMGQHDGPGLFGICFLKPCYIYIILRNRNISKNRDGSVLDDRSYCRGKTCRHGYDLVSPFNLSVPEKRRGQRHKGKEVGGGA